MTTQYLSDWDELAEAQRARRSVAALRPRERGAPDRPEGGLPFDWGILRFLGTS
jgi:hypothetical protein